MSAKNNCIVLEGLCEVDVSKWTFALNGQTLDSIFRRALSLEDMKEDFKRMLLRVHIELEPVDTFLLLDGEPLAPPKPVPPEPELKRD